MTTRFISRFSGLLISTLFVSNSFSQVSEFKNLQPAIIIGTHLKVYDNILTEFRRLYAGAQNVKWSKVDNNYLAEFFMNEQNQRVLLNPRADLLYQISYGTEKHLPVDIRKAVKRIYVEYTISSVAKVQEANRIIWIVNAEDSTTLVSLRVEGNEFEETQKYAKSNSKCSQANLVKQ
ncbi:MAG: hypothetical protein H7122_18000 [Chitinophagaceae bacterium]|nr:hypothetical protein [Chitinophagaceae bacterium]